MQLSAVMGVVCNQVVRILAVLAWGFNRYRNPTLCTKIPTTDV